MRTILAIPHLFSVVTIAKTKNKAFRPNREETAETILMSVSVCSVIPLRS